MGPRPDAGGVVRHGHRARAARGAARQRHPPMALRGHHSHRAAPGLRRHGGPQSRAWFRRNRAHLRRRVRRLDPGRPVLRRRRLQEQRLQPSQHRHRRVPILPVRPRHGPHRLGDGRQRQSPLLWHRLQRHRRRGVRHRQSIRQRLRGVPDRQHHARPRGQPLVLRGRHPEAQRRPDLRRRLRGGPHGGTDPALPHHPERREGRRERQLRQRAARPGRPGQPGQQLLHRPPGRGDLLQRAARPAAAPAPPRHPLRRPTPTRRRYSPTAPRATGGSRTPAARAAPRRPTPPPAWTARTAAA